jgi:hypothetical protein
VVEAPRIPRKSSQRSQPDRCQRIPHYQCQNSGDVGSVRSDVRLLLYQRHPPTQFDGDLLLSRQRPRVRVPPFIPKELGEGNTNRWRSRRGNVSRPFFRGYLVAVFGSAKSDNLFASGEKTEENVHARRRRKRNHPVNSFAAARHLWFIAVRLCWPGLSQLIKKPAVSRRKSRIRVPSLRRQVCRVEIDWKGAASRYGRNTPESVITDLGLICP